MVGAGASGRQRALLDRGWAAERARDRSKTRPKPQRAIWQAARLERRANNEEQIPLGRRPKPPPPAVARQETSPSVPPRDALSVGVPVCRVLEIASPFSSPVVVQQYSVRRISCAGGMVDNVSRWTAPRKQVLIAWGPCMRPNTNVPLQDDVLAPLSIALHDGEVPGLPPQGRPPGGGGQSASRSTPLTGLSKGETRYFCHGTRPSRRRCVERRALCVYLYIQRTASSTHIGPS